MKTSLEGNVELTQRLREWLDRVGIDAKADQASIAVDAADIVAASEKVAALLEVMIEADARSPTGADEALTVAAEIEVQLFTELKSHLRSLEKLWPKVLEKLDSVASSGT